MKHSPSFSHRGAIGRAFSTLLIDRREVSAHLWRPDGGWLRIYREHFVMKRGRDPAMAEAWRLQIEATSRWLWESLMGPLHHHLSNELGLQAGAQVTLSPPGLLGSLPLHAAGPSSEATCFDDHWTVTYTPSIRAHLICRDRLRRNRELSPKLLAVIDPFLAGLRQTSALGGTGGEDFAKALRTKRSGY